MNQAEEEDKNRLTLGYMNKNNRTWCEEEDRIKRKSDAFTIFFYHLLWLERT